MTLSTIVWKELRERPMALATSALAIFLSVAALVAIRHVSVFSERAVSKQLETLGANILILPRESTLQDYYSADQNGGTIPESYATEVLLAGLTGVEYISPRLCVSATVAEQQVVLTGILPQSEFKAQSTWQSVSLFQNRKKPSGCAKPNCKPRELSATPDSLASDRLIDELAENQVIAGAELAERLHLKAGQTVSVLGEPLRVLAVLPPSGTIDDTRLFAHLHMVQHLAKTGEVVNAIEVMGCCQDVAGELVPQLATLLPASRVVTISQVVQAQVGVNQLMATSSLFVLAVLVLVGGATVASAISANVRERRREIGTLMALGATARFVSGMFLLKAMFVGLLGGIGGAAAGAGLAIWLGPAWAGVAVSPLAGLMALAVVSALAVTMLAAVFPTLQASRLDPCICFREV